MRFNPFVSLCGIVILFAGLVGCEGAHRIKVETAYGPGARIGGKGYTYNWAKDVSAAAIVRDWAGPAAVEPLVADATGAHWLGSLARAGLDVHPPRILGIAGVDERWHVDRTG